ncbi:hypothetical protein, partial [Candidatus Avelusimicrobium alvi]|uniref:hypothetical protein n=1 Tax=Candidatus Avelusimicrobium alvi TaxID=3416221 RepID=UPI003D0FDB3F
QAFYIFLLLFLKEAKGFTSFFWQQKKEQKDCRPMPIKSSFTRRVLQLAIAQTNKTLLPRKTDFIDGLRPEPQRQQQG